jgi:hypothetical protein
LKYKNYNDDEMSDRKKWRQEKAKKYGWSAEREKLFDANYVMHEECLLIFLALINTPRIIGRRQHMPHKSLEAKLSRLGFAAGKYPLHAWNEIRLEVGIPRDLSDEASTEAHLTGRKALHFCRSHIRIRLGRIEIVRAHWRGDAAVGIKRSRYKLELPN